MLGVPGVAPFTLKGFDVPVLEGVKVEAVIVLFAPTATACRVIDSVRSPLEKFPETTGVIDPAPALVVKLTVPLKLVRADPLAVWALIVTLKDSPTFLGEEILSK